MSLMRPEIEDLEPSGIARIALPRFTDPDVIPLWIGEGDTITAEFIREAAKRAIDEGHTFYAHTRGRAELRDAIKAYLDRVYGIDLDPERISVPGSSMMGITLAAQMSVGHGRHALIVSPNWPNIENTLRATGADVSFVRQRVENGRWHLDAQDIIAAVRADTHAIYINSPCNPTGWIVPQTTLESLLALCRERNIVLISDEVYHRTVFDRDVAPSLITLAGDDDPVIIVNGFSKAWAMTGWRLGWMIAPARYATHIAVLSECFNTGAPSIMQFGGIAALRDGEALVETLRTQYAGARDIVMEVLGRHPRVALPQPEGAFYAFPRVDGIGSSLAFAEKLLQEYDVGVAPGYTFGPDNDEHFRLCFAQSHGRLTEALGRIVACIDARG
ncbi:MAG: aminotransferase class I/II-fold pyridoxal phosphate-dependent enzyme [Gammaproteobacteria bacterium]|nr:aminotransferase class I/II-fold pyridoxal phosphate-dependent enzyme [Gammaproteobacteria bacterium]NIM73633.1 aminotransferase class I/II-fold pyridoxal phosphate-dependent enzyme [Gammaproteobacteria bacterium]NIN40287.1 aminotransferase class I/II-fold pyridoxal phosphate-dependent enzyme [Gammaproteobacteria bacterium]NIO25450.1 aminotransferase class I/II-fold pyridoxal phosphate-dependent enzyme [Gammaproteobacteria bacterium]NIO66127.1 aminotransferase class I/II-fold pyridoxal phosp